jgi:hypothetical protein
MRKKKKKEKKKKKKKKKEDETEDGYRSSACLRVKAQTDLNSS